MRFEYFLNNYGEALKFPHEEFHAYCMDMADAMPEDMRMETQHNYMQLLLAIEKQRLRDKKKRRK